MLVRQASQAQCKQLEAEKACLEGTVCGARASLAVGLFPSQTTGRSLTIVAGCRPGGQRLQLDRPAEHRQRHTARRAAPCWPYQRNNHSRFVLASLTGCQSPVLCCCPSAHRHRVSSVPAVVSISLMLRTQVLADTLRRESMNLDLEGRKLRTDWEDKVNQSTCSCCQVQAELSCRYLQAHNLKKAEEDRDHFKVSVAASKLA